MNLDLNRSTYIDIETKKCRRLLPNKRVKAGN